MSPPMNLAPSIRNFGIGVGVAVGGFVGTEVEVFVGIGVDVFVGTGVDVAVGEGDVHEAFGLTLMVEGKYEEAEKELRAGLGVANEVDVPDRKAIAERNLGRLYKVMGRDSVARAHLSRAAQMFDDIGMAHEALRTKDMLTGLKPPLPEELPKPKKGLWERD